jgi:hypothetical protein
MFGYRRRFFAPGRAGRLLALDSEQTCEWTFPVRALRYVLNKQRDEM